MAEFWIRVDCYLEADDLTQACHTVMEALSNATTETFLTDGGPAQPRRVPQSAKEPS